jgi:hypothetical protein
MPDPTASAVLSTIVRGTWPGYFGGGLLRIENSRLQETAMQADLFALAGRKASTHARRRVVMMLSMGWSCPIVSRVEGLRSDPRTFSKSLVCAAEAQLHQVLQSFTP